MTTKDRREVCISFDEREVLRSRVDYATRGNLDFSKDDLVKAMDLEPSINIGRSRWEMHLGMPGSEEYVTRKLASPTFEGVNARYSFMTDESAAMDETVDRWAKEGAEALRALPSTYSYSRPIIEDTRIRPGQNSSVASTRLRDPI